MRLVSEGLLKGSLELGMSPEQLLQRSVRGFFDLEPSQCAVTALEGLCRSVRQALSVLRVGGKLLEELR